MELDAKAQKKFDAIKKIVDSESYAKIEGTTIDLTTAGMLLYVLNSIKTENKAKLLSMPIKQMVGVGWKLTSKSESSMSNDLKSSKYHSEQQSRYQVMANTAKSQMEMARKEGDRPAILKHKKDMESWQEKSDEHGVKQIKAIEAERPNAVKDRYSDLGKRAGNESFLNEKEYTDKDALKDHKRIMDKVKARIAGLKQSIKDDQEMIKDKMSKMQGASSEKGKHGTMSQKDRYKSNIDKIGARIKEDQKIIQELEKELKERMSKHKEATKSSKGESMKLSKQLSTLIESLEGGELEKLQQGEPVEITIGEEDEDEIVVDDITDLSGDEEDDVEINDEDEDEYDDDYGDMDYDDEDGEEYYDEEDEEEDEMSEEDADAEIEKEEKELTEEEIEAEKEYEEGEEAEVTEAKSTFPKAKQIKTIKALKKKLSAQMKAKKSMEISASNAWSKAKSKKDRKGMLKATKDKKKFKAEYDKISSINKRANDQLSKLETERKNFNKKKKTA